MCILLVLLHMKVEILAELAARRQTSRRDLGMTSAARKILAEILGEIDYTFQTGLISIEIS